MSSKSIRKLCLSGFHSARFLCRPSKSLSISPVLLTLSLIPEVPLGLFSVLVDHSHLFNT